MNSVNPKKRWGQHFLKDKQLAEKIVNQLQRTSEYTQLLEIGPGTGVLTQFLVKKPSIQLTAVEIDPEAVAYLKQSYSIEQLTIIEKDFLQLDLSTHFTSDFGVIGNFPYNISSQLFFKLLEYKDQVKEIVCMLQKEVAIRIASPPGNKDYGILSVFLQAFFDITYLFTVHEHSFHPPPRVKSAVIRLIRNNRAQLPCDEKLFFRIVKQSFQMRRKMLRNNLKSIFPVDELQSNPIFNKRAEELSVEDFIDLAKKAEVL